MCKGCHKNLSDDATVLRDGANVFHKECFVCDKCYKFLGAVGEDFFEAESRMLCRECYTKRMYRCTACQQPLVTANGTEVEVGGNLYHK